MCARLGFIVSVFMVGAAQAQAPNPSVCDRTPQVRDAIVEWVQEEEDISDCSEVTANHLQWLGRREQESEFGAYNVWVPFRLEGNITELQKGDFANFEYLEQLEITGNPIKTLPDSVFTGLENLESLEILNNQLATLPDSVFVGLKKLRILDMSNNQLTTLSVGVFADLKNLQVMLLRRNLFKTFPAGVFTDLENLHTLLLSENYFAALPEGIFTGLKSLTSLSLYGNPGIPFTLPLELIRTDDNVSTFDSAEVAIRVVTGMPFEGQVTLSVTGGEASPEVVTLEPGTMVSAPVKITRDVDNTGAVRVFIAQVPKHDVIDGTKYHIRFRADSLLLFPDAIIPDPAVCDRTSQVQDAIIERLESVSECSEVTGEDLLSLEGAILLSDIRMDELQKGDFAGLDSLKALHLNDNEFTILPDSSFLGLDSLRVLYLHNNRLITLAPHTFAGLKNLRVLRLHDNDITVLPEGIFSGLTKLTELWLYNNQLTELPGNMFADLRSLTRLSLRENPGVPFQFVLEVVRTDDDPDVAGPAKVAVSVFDGMPLWGKPSLSLSAAGGRVKPEMVTLEPGTVVSTPATVTRDADNRGTVEVSITQVDPGPLATGVSFIRVPLVLFEGVLDPDGPETETTEELPEEVSLSVNYPNPFNPGTTIHYALPTAATLRLAVYDVLGREVAVLADGVQAAGGHTVRFDAGHLPSGTYIVRLDTDERSIVRTMTLSR